MNKLRKLSFDVKDGPQEGDWGKVSGSFSPIEGLAKVLSVNKKEGVCLVEFLSAHPELHDGNVGPVKGKDKHCWWVARDDIRPVIVDSVIVREGREVLCLPGRGTKVGAAKCCEGETFDPVVGAIIALARAHGMDPTAAAKKVLDVMSAVKKDEPELRLVDKFGTGFGKVGDPTPYRDSLGTALYVGDEVELKNTRSSRRYGLRWVASTKENGPFVMGIQLACNPKTGKIRDEWEVTLRTSYKERFAGEEADDGVLSIRSPKDLDRGKKIKDRNKKEGRV